MKRVPSLENVATIGDGSDGMPGKPSKKGKPKPKISGSNCDMCTLACSKELQCYVCSKLAHLRCCGVPKGNTLVLAVIQELCELNHLHLINTNITNNHNISLQHN